MLQVLFRAAEETATKNPLFPEIYDIVWSIIPFVLVIALFGWVVLPRLNKTLDARAEAIEGGIQKAEVAQAEAAAALEQYQAQLADGRAEAAKIREQARAEGTQILNELKEQANAEAARILANAQSTIEAERQAALISLRKEVGTLAIDLASGVVGQALTDDKKSAKLVDDFLADLESGSTAKAGR